MVIIMFMKYWKLKDSCTVCKIGNWRHYKGKSHSGRVRSSVAQDVKVQVTPLPQTSCVTSSKSLSLINVQKRVFWGLSLVCPKTRLAVSLISKDSHPWPHVEPTGSRHSKQARWLCVLQSTPGQGVSGCSQCTCEPREQRNEEGGTLYSSRPFLLNGKFVESGLQMCSAQVRAPLSLMHNLQKHTELIGTESVVLHWHLQTSEWRFSYDLSYLAGVCPDLVTMTTWNIKTNTFESGKWFWVTQVTPYMCDHLSENQGISRNT